ncbi:hypothetical protein [Psychromonas aquimarina]|uniref:hypothetical protein n=1 Tax=Psychromonas aquimarina TaxID=444919 RepID=UPI00041C3A28|nr:hypothetical protein [Psychromonas aquimarina]
MQDTVCDPASGQGISVPDDACWFDTKFKHNAGMKSDHYEYFMGACSLEEGAMDTNVNYTSSPEGLTPGHTAVTLTIAEDCSDNYGNWTKGTEVGFSEDDWATGTEFATMDWRKSGKAKVYDISGLPDFIVPPPASGEWKECWRLENVGPVAGEDIYLCQLDGNKQDASDAANFCELSDDTDASWNVKSTTSLAGASYVSELALNYIKNGDDKEGNEYWVEDDPALCADDDNREPLIEVKHCTKDGCTPEERCAKKNDKHKVMCQITDFPGNID